MRQKDSRGAANRADDKAGDADAGRVSDAGRAGDAGRDQAERQGFDRQRLEPQDSPPADVLDDGNLAGEKDFELGPPGGKR